MTPVRHDAAACICGHPYTGHPGADDPSGRYQAVRAAFIDDALRLMPFRPISPAHQRAILRARRERRAVIA